MASIRYVEPIVIILEKEIAAHSSILAWRNPMERGAWPGYSPWGRKESDSTDPT